MEIVDLTGRPAAPIVEFGSTDAASVRVADGSGDAHVHVIVFEPGGQIGPHEAGFGQLLVPLSGSGWIASMSERIRRLNMQLPSTSPTAMSGSAASAVAPNPVKSSGRLVVAASSTRPIQLRPQPLFSPSMSP